MATRTAARGRPLSLLHRVIQIVMNWDGDHLHAFTVGRNRYGDPSYTADLGETT